MVERNPTNMNICHPAHAPGTTALWRYRAIYLNGDEQFGQWSEPASIAVRG